MSRRVSTERFSDDALASIEAAEKKALALQRVVANDATDHWDRDRARKRLRKVKRKIEDLTLDYWGRAMSIRGLGAIAGCAMKTDKLYAALQALAKQFHDRCEDPQAERFQSDVDAAELIRVLARMVGGLGELAKPVALELFTMLHRAFGAPGDWGYGTPIGDGLRALYEGGVQ